MERLKISTLLLLFTIANHVQGQLTYSVKPLINFLHEKMEKKLETNYYMNPLIMEQNQHPKVCSSSQGPHCHFVNKKRINDKEEENNLKYLQVKAASYQRIMHISNRMADSIKDMGGKQGFIYYNKERRRLDSTLYPRIFPKVHTFTFTFETFELKPEISRIAPGIKAFGKLTKENKDPSIDQTHGVVEFNLRHDLLDDQKLAESKFKFQLLVYIHNFYLPKKG